MRNFINSKYFHIILILTLMIVAAICCFAPSIRGNDGVQNVAYLQSLLFDRDLNFTNNYQQYFFANPEWFNGVFPPSDPVTGRPINLYGVGNSILWAPLFCLAYLGWWFIAPDALPASGTFVYPYAIGLQSLIYAMFGTILVFRLLKRYFSSASAFWSTIAIWFASPLFFYAHAHGSMSHANSFFLFALLMTVYLKLNRTWHWTIIGLISGMIILVRFQDVTLLTFLLIGEILSLYDSRQQTVAEQFVRKSKAYATFLVCFFTVVSLQFVAWYYLQGTPFSGPRAYMNQGSFSLIPTHCLQVLFSPFHGLFYWHPILFLGFVGLLLYPGTQQANRVRYMCIGTFIATLWLVSSWSCWWAGASFGHRMFISNLPLLAFGLASLYSRIETTSPRLTLLIKAAVIVGIVWNVGLLWQYAHIIPRDEPVQIITILKNYGRLL